MTCWENAVCLLAILIMTAKKKRTVAGIKKIPVYCLPFIDVEQAKWVKTILNDTLIINKNTVVCALHWSKNFETVEGRGGKLRPKNAPSVWPGIPVSQVPTASVPERTTQRSSSSCQNAQNDELPSFLAQD